MTPLPYDLFSSYRCVYDAWNRLVRIEEGSEKDGKPVVEFVYDGLGRRIAKRTYQKGNVTETRHYYYNHLWQILEERIEKAKTRLRDTPPERLYLWGLRGLNDLVLRDRDTNGNGTLDERLYAVQDANSNVVALMDTAGNVVERFCYDPYGQPLFLRSGKFEASSAFEWNILYAGYYYDADTGLYDVRRRIYHPTLGRWLQTDPLGYQDSLNVYQYAFSSPLTYVDPTGEVVLAAALIAAGVYLLKVGIESAVETALEAGIAHYVDDETFSVGGAFARNIVVNLGTSWIPGAVEGKIAFKAGRLGAKIAGRAGYKFAYYGMKYGSEYVAETAVETAWEGGIIGARWPRLQQK